MKKSRLKYLISYFSLFIFGFSFLVFLSCEGKKVTIEDEDEDEVIIIDEDGEGEAVNAPKEPLDLTVDVGKTQVDVNWRVVDGAKGYRVYYDLDSGRPYEGTDAREGRSPIEVDGNSMTLTGLKNGRTYYFTVTAFNEAGESGFSSEVAAVMVPGSPGGITASGGTRQIFLSWDGVHGAEGYRVYYDLDSGEPYEGVDADQGNSPIETKETEMIITSLREGTTYYIIIKAYNAQGEHGHEAEIVITTLPPVPGGLTATAGVGTVTLIWDESKSATSYKVYYDSDESGPPYEGTCALQGSSPVSTNKNEFILQDLIIGYPYYFTVSALNTSGESGLSLEVIVDLVPEGFRLISGGVVDIGGDLVSSDKEIKASGQILEPAIIKGNKYKVILE